MDLRKTDPREQSTQTAKSPHATKHHIKSHKSRLLFPMFFLLSCGTMLKKQQENYVSVPVSVYPVVVGLGQIHKTAYRYLPVNSKKLFQIKIQDRGEFQIKRAD